MRRFLQTMALIAMIGNIAACVKPTSSVDECGNGAFDLDLYYCNQFELTFTEGAGGFDENLSLLRRALKPAGAKTTYTSENLNIVRVIFPKASSMDSNKTFLEELPYVSEAYARMRETTGQG